MNGDFVVVGDGQRKPHLKSILDEFQIFQEKVAEPLILIRGSSELNGNNELGLSISNGHSGSDWIYNFFLLDGLQRANTRRRPLSIIYATTHNDNIGDEMTILPPGSYIVHLRVSRNPEPDFKQWVEALERMPGRSIDISLLGLLESYLLHGFRGPREQSPTIAKRVSVDDSYYNYLNEMLESIMENETTPRDIPEQAVDRVKKQKNNDALVERVAQKLVNGEWPIQFSESEYGTALALIIEVTMLSQPPVPPQECPSPLCMWSNFLRPLLQFL